MSGASVFLGVAIQDFSPIAGVGYSHPIIVPRQRSEIAHNYQPVFFGATFAYEAENAAKRVVAVDPFESGWIEVQLVQSRLLAIGPIEVFHPALERRMGRIVKEVPVEAFLMIPFVPLTELTTHEEEFLPRLCIHVTIEKSQIGEFLPVVSGHLSDQ